MTEQRISYTGERVYVGIDVHKETYTVTCVCHKQIVKTATVPAEPASLAASLPRWFPGATLTSAYEAGFSAFVLHRALTQVGITNIVSPRKPRSWHGFSREPAHRLSNTGPRLPARSKPSSTSLVCSPRPVGA